MPFYEYHCPTCGIDETLLVDMKWRDDQICRKCRVELFRKPSLPNVKVKGAAAGPDRFTADALGMDVRDLPPGLRTK